MPLSNKRKIAEAAGAEDDNGAVVVDRIADQLHALAVPIESLRPDPMNARLHNERNLESIKESLCLFGQVKPLVARRGVDGDDAHVVIAGNGTLAAARQLGWTMLAVTLVDMTDMEAIGYGLADNRTSELAKWDYEVVQRLHKLQEEAGQVAVGWTDKELEFIRMADWTPPDEGGGDNADDIEAPWDRTAELQEKWQVRKGDLWLVPSKTVEGGCHKILCGDSTDSQHVSALLGKTVPFMMVTDPPYGVNYDAGWREESNVKGGLGEYQNFRQTMSVKNDVECDWSGAWQLFPGDVAYVWHASLRIPETFRSLIECGFLPRSQVIWAKPHFLISRGHYHWQHEPCVYCVRKGKTARWSGDRKQTTLWEIAGLNPMGRSRSDDDAPTGHGTQKPVECMARPMRNHGAPGDVVYDPFLGSGTTVVAAEQERRICYGIEIAEEVTAMCLERLYKAGLNPRRNG